MCLTHAVIGPVTVFYTDIRLCKHGCDVTAYFAENGALCLYNLMQTLEKELSQTLSRVCIRLYKHERPFCIS